MIAPTPPRPTAVTVAFAFQLGLAVLLLLLSGATFAEAVRYDGLIDEALRIAGPAWEEDAAMEREAGLAGLVLLGLPAALMAVWFSITAIGLVRGSNVARILSLVGLGVPVVLGFLGACLGGLAAMLLIGIDPGTGADETWEGGEEPATPVGGPDFYDELWRLDEDGPWMMAYGLLTSLGIPFALLLGVATAVLLLTGPANRYFRPRPPLPWPAYPAPYWQGPYRY